MATLKDKAISGVFWSLLQKFGAQGIFIIVNIILARILTPEDFGLVAMLAIFISLSQVLASAGFSTALIQKLNVDEEDYSSVFYINLLISILLYIILFLTAPLIAQFYNQAILIPLTRVLSLVFVIDAFSYVQTTRLQKDVQFKILMIIHIPSTVIGGIVSVAMALWGYGVWSIVALQIVTNLAYAVQIWLYSKWKPMLKFSMKKVKDLFSFGGKIALSDFIYFAYLNIYPVVLGKYFPLKTVGYYQTANKFAMTPGTTAMLAIRNATFPVFSSLQQDKKVLKEAFRKGLQQLAFWLFPLFVLTAVLASPLFQLIFTEKWLPAVPYFRWLCVAGVFIPLSIFSIQIITAKGKSTLYLRLNIIEKVVFFVGVIVSIPFGVNVLIAVQAISTVLIYCLNSYFSTRLIEYSFKEQVKDIMPILLLSIIIGAIILIIETFFVKAPDILQLLLGFILGGLMYWNISRYLNFPPYQEVMLLFKGKIIPKLKTYI